MHLMILGAGPFQASGIKKAVKMGYEVTTVDYLPDSIGNQLSHHYVNLSTTDFENVFSAAQRAGINGICTFSSDVAIPTVGYVCDRLGLPGLSFNTARIMSSKHTFRNFQHSEGLNHPIFFSAHSLDELKINLQTIKPPCILKPVDASGSRGISKIASLEHEELIKAFSYAKRHSRSGMVCIEESLEGIEIGGDGFLIDGRFSFVAITQKHMNGFVVTGHSLPTNISQLDQGRVVEELETACTKLNYKNGSLNFDVMVSPKKVVILEMSARNGGNGIPLVINQATGVDLEVLTIRSAMGVKVSLPESAMNGKFPTVGHCAGSYVFGSTIGGTLTSIATLNEMLENVPEVTHYHLFHKSGDKILPFEHNGNLLGYAVFHFDIGKYSDTIQRLKSVLNIRISKIPSRVTSP
jgi:biotin carboxylase